MEQSHLSSQIGKRIKLYRKQQKMTLEDLAACINRSKATVSKYECGAIVLDVETLYEIAGALQVPLSCLMEIPEERADNRAISAKEMLPSRLYFYIYRDRGTREIALLLSGCDCPAGVLPRQYSTMIWRLESRKDKSDLHGRRICHRHHLFVSGDKLSKQTGSDVFYLQPPLYQSK